jgi:hypothetical protein
VFVDESGLPSIDEYYVVAGCWCISDIGPAPTLNETRIDLQDLMVDLEEIPSNKTELKGTDITHKGLDVLFSSLTTMANKDGTIKGPPYPWDDDSTPIQFTYAEVDAGVGREAFTEFGHDLNTPKLLQSMLLLSILRPVLYGSNLDESLYDRVRVILDSKTWEQAKQTLEDAGRASELIFETDDSHKVPGIQLADLAAHVRRKKRKGTTYETADSTLDRLELE